MREWCNGSTTVFNMEPVTGNNNSEHDDNVELLTDNADDTDVGMD